jgi:hypothetical protein
MTTALPVAFYRTESLEDVAAIATGDSGYLVTVEHTRELAAPALTVPSERTIWRFWKPDREGTSFHEASHRTVILPLSTSVVMTLENNRLIALAHVNEPKPAFLLAWDTRAGDAPHLGESATSHLTIELDRLEAAKVQIPLKYSWNTRTLPESRWLFHPSLASLPGGAQVALAMNTADGRAVVWTSDGVDKPKPLAFLPGALNPVLIRVSGKDRLLYRRMPADWSVYYHDLRYSGQYGPIALPLAMAELDSDGGIAHSNDLSQGQGVGNVFDFVAANAGTRLVLAVVSGTKEAPELRVYVGDPTGGTLHLLRTARVRGVPYRLTMAVAGGGALIGLAYTTERGSELEGTIVQLQ